MRTRWFNYWIIDPIWGSIDYLTHQFLRCLSLERASAAGAILGRLAKHRFKTAQSDILANLASLFPAMSETDKQDLAERLWDNIGRTLTEMAMLDRFSQDHIRFIDQGGIFDRLDRKRPVIFLFPHLGNWELLAWFVTRQGFDLNIIYEHLPNRFQRKLVAASRRRTGYELISPDYRGTRQLFRNLAAGQSAGIAMDEFKHNKIIAPAFYGVLSEQSNIHYAIALSRRFNAPLVTGYCIRKSAISFEITCANLYLPDDPACASDPDLAESINAACQQWIKQYPDQWYMLHRARLKLQ